MTKTVLGLYLHQPEARALATYLHDHWIDEMTRPGASEAEAWGSPTLRDLYVKLAAFAWPEGECHAGD